MANRTWGGGSNSPPVGGWSVAANWTGDTKPTNADDAILDGTDTAACTCDEAIDVLSLTVAAAYSGKLDFADSAYAHAIGGDATFDGSGEVDCGDATITCGGNFDNKDQTTWTPSTSELVMTGTTKIIRGASSNQLYDLTIQGTVTLSSGTTTSVQVLNTVHVDGGELTLVKLLNCVGSCVNDGVISGTSLRLVNCTISNTGTWTATTGCWRACTINAGTYGGTWTCHANTSGNTLAFGGAATFTGAITFDANAATYEVDTNNQNLTFQGDLTLAESVGTLTWTKGTGTITLSGTSNQTITTLNKSLEDIVINKSAGDVDLVDGLTTESFTGTSTGTGDFDPNGQTLTIAGACDWAAAFTMEGGADHMNGSDWQVGGNFTCDGQTLNATANWDLDVTGTAVASGTGSVEQCTAGGTEITASAGPWADGGNNVNWDFGGVAVNNILVGGGIFG